MAYFVVARGASIIQECRLSDGDMLTVGRDTSCEVCLPDPTCTVSRVHAVLIRLSRADEQYLLRDLGSLNSVKVSGEHVYQRRLSEGDVIQVGDYRLTFRATFPGRAALGRLRVVAQKERWLPALETRQQTAAASADPRGHELVQQVLQLSRRRIPLEELLGELIGPTQRYLRADRGLACLFAGPGGIEVQEVAAIGFHTADTMDITDSSYLDRLRRGEVVKEENTILIPIRSKTRSTGFFCFDRSAPAEGFTQTQIEFLREFGSLIAGKTRETAAAGQPASADELVEWPLTLVGKSRAMKEIYEQMRRAAAGGMHVLLYGESGTGKELVAGALHELSPNARGPFVARNCAAVPESLAETEMFGYEEKSGIQNADPKGVPGWFELAHGGTLFLDEIQALSLPLQDKLLRVLQDGQVWRVAARRARPVDVRVVGATDIDPARAIEEGRYRKALYYRFGKTIGLPPLRKRPEDIPLLAFLFLDRYAARSGSKTRTISHRALQVLCSHSWPGNVRELENAVRDAVSRNKEVILCADLPPVLSGASQARETRGHLAPAIRAEEAPKTWSETEKQAIQRVLESTRGNITKAAEILKVARMTVINMMKRHSIPRNFGRG